jgi:hypothetical protein
MHIIQLVLDHLLQTWRHLSDHEVEHPICCSGYGDTLGSKGERHDFWRVKPWNRSPTENYNLGLESDDVDSAWGGIPVTKGSIEGDDTSIDSFWCGVNVEAHLPSGRKQRYTAL